VAVAEQDAAARAEPVRQVLAAARCPRGGAPQRLRDGEPRGAERRAWRGRLGDEPRRDESPHAS